MEVEGILRAALEGRPAPRALFAPLVCSLAADIEALDRREFLLDAGKMSKLLTELQRGAGLDVVWVSSGEGLFAPEQFEAATETARRLRQSLGGRALVGAAVKEVEMSWIRTLLDAGVQVLLLRAELMGMQPTRLRPAVASIRFRRALAALPMPFFDEEFVIAAGEPLPVVSAERAVATRAFGVALTAEELDAASDWPSGTTLVTTWQGLDQEVSLARLQGWRATR